MKDQIQCHVRFMFTTDALLVLKNPCNTVSKYSPIYNKLVNEWNTETMKIFIDYLKKKTRKSSPPPTPYEKNRKMKPTAVQRRLGEYWRRREARSIASGGILLWKICTKKLKSQKGTPRQTNWKKQTDKDSYEGGLFDETSWRLPCCLGISVNILRTEGQVYVNKGQKPKFNVRIP